MDSAAATILKRAVELDTQEQYTMALALYQEGVRILLDSIKETVDTVKQKHFALKAKQYLDRAEKIKVLVDTKKKNGTYRESNKIQDGATGYGYNSLFGRFLDSTITDISIEDPYIRTFYQCQNLLRLCELAVQKCRTLTKISLLTSTGSKPEDTKNQIAWLDELKQSLQHHLVTFDYKFSETLHDRQIVLSNGWIIKIGRGLNYFKAPDGRFVLGACDLELRHCLETTVDIFHKSEVKNATK